MLLMGSAQQQPARWTLGPTPSVTLGADDRDPAALLESVVGATRLADGSILVGDRGDFALKRFSPTGKFDRAFARQGAGPGEVRYLVQMLRCGDTVYTYDADDGHRVSAFTLDGRYVRTFRFHRPMAAQVPSRSACNSAGDFVHLGWSSTSEMSVGPHRPAVPVWMSRGDSTDTRMIDVVAGPERWGFAQGVRLAGTRPLPLGKQPVVGIGRSRLYVGTADRFQLRVFDLSGRAVGALQRDEAPMAVSPRREHRAVVSLFAERRAHRRGDGPEIPADLRDWG